MPMTMAPLRRSKRLKSVRPWLDLLGLDVCTQIASYVSRGQDSMSLLHLSELSAHQSSAVLTALEHKLDLSIFPSAPSFKGILRRWASFSAHTLVELNLRLPLKRDDGMSCNAVQALARLLATAPNLRNATLPNESLLVAPLTRATSLDHLTIWIQHEEEITPWLFALSRKKTKLALTTLVPKCHTSVFCPF